MSRSHLIRSLFFTIILIASLLFAQTAATQEGIAVAPTITIGAPTSGQVVNTSPVDVSFTASNFVIGPWDTPHIAFYLDEDPQPFSFYNGSDNLLFGHQVVLRDFTPTSAAAWLNENTFRFNDLPNGTHTITARLTDFQGNPLPNPEASFTVAFTVDQAADNLTPPNGLVFVKEQLNPQVPPPNATPGMGRVFNNNPSVIGDLYLLSPVSPSGDLYQLTDVAPAGGGVTDPEVSYDGQRVLFSMRQSATDNWHIWEMNLDGSNLHQITFNPPYAAVNDLDPDYLPDGRIIFASDRLKQREMKPYDQAISTQLYIVNADGSDLHQVDYNANFDINPQVARNGQILFDRWDHLSFIRNLFSLWRMNQDGSNGLVHYGGVSPRFNQQGGENANALESRELDTGEMVGIFTNRDALAGKMGIFDPRTFNSENQAFPLMIGPAGLYRTPHPLTNTELIYSYTPNPAPQHNGFGLYTMQLTPESVLVDDATNSTPPGPGLNPTFRTYEINLDAPGRIYLEVSGIADDNGANPPDRAWVRVNGVDYDGGTQDIERKLDGSLTFGAPYSYRIDIDLDAGAHTIHIVTDATPTLTRVRIVRAIAAANHALLYDDPNTNEVSPIPVRVRNLPPLYPSQTNPELNWGTFVVRDVSLRGDFRQANYQDPDGDPDYPYHMDLEQIQGLRVKQNLPRRSETQDILVGASFYDPVRVVGVATPNATGTVAFKALAGVTTAWDLIDLDGGAIVHERVWSWVQPGEVRSCNGCHVGAFPYEPREIGTIPDAQDLRQRGEVYTFVDQALPILQSKCASCHTGQNPAGGLNLTGDRYTFDALLLYVNERTPTQYAINGVARFSFLYQLLSGKTNINPLYTFRLNQINNNVNHTHMLNSSELYDVATWLDTGAGFAYLPWGFGNGAPSVVSVFPPDGANGVKRNTGVAVRFDAPIDRATVNSDTFVLSRSNGNVVEGSWEWGTNNDVYFRPDNQNLPNGQYELSISGNILNIKNALPGTPLESDFFSVFNLVNGLDNSPPQVTTYTPAGSDAEPFAPVRVAFDEFVIPGSINEQTFTVVDSKGFFMDGRLYVHNNGQEVNWFPWSPFQAGETYTVNLSGGIRDLANNQLAPFSFDFTIAASATPQYHSLVAEVPTDTDPKRMAVNQLGSEFLVANKYSNQITRYAVGSWEMVASYPVGGGPTDVAYSADNARAYVLNAGDNSVQIVNLADGSIMAEVTAGLITPDWLLPNHAGNRLYLSDIGGAGYIHEIDVVVGSPTFGEILRTFNLGKVPSRPTLSADDKTLYYGSPFAFNIFDVNAGSETHSLYIPYGLVGPVTLAPDGAYALAPATSSQSARFIDLFLNQDRGEISLPDNVDHLAFSPDGQFLYLTLRSTQSMGIMDVLTWQMVADLPAAKDGNTFIQSLVINPDSQLVFAVAGGLATQVLVYHVADPSDTTPPSVIQFNPADGAADQTLYTPIRVNFSEPIDRLTLTDSSFSVTDSSGAAIGGRFYIHMNGVAVDFLPTTFLAVNETYTVALSSDVRDLSGNSLAAFSYTFATVDGPASQYHSQEAVISTQVDPKRMALNHAGTEFLVTNKYENLITRHAASSWETIASYPVAAGPYDVVYSADDAKAYVLNTTAKNVQIINLSTGDILHTIGDPLITPDRLLVNHAGTRLYVSDIGGAGYIHEIDVVVGSDTFGDILRTFNLGRIPSAPTISPDDAYLYFGSASAFNALDLAAAQIGYSIYVPYGTVGAVALSPNGDYALAPSLSSQSLTLIDLNIRQDRLSIALPDNVDHMAFGPNGRFLYLVLRANQNLAVMDAASMQIVAQLPTAQINTTFVQSITVSPDSRHIFAVAGGLAAAVLVFEAADPNDVTPPTITHITPANDSSDVPLSAPIRVTFSEPLDRLTLHSDTFSVVNSSGVAANGRIYVAANGMVANFLPDPLLSANETYTVSLTSGVRDLAGNSLAPYAYTFATVSGPVSQYHAQTAVVNTDIDPKRMAVNYAGTQLLVANKYNNLITHYAAGSWEELGRYTVGLHPHDVAFSADDTLAYILNSGDKSVQFLNLSDGALVYTTTGFLTPDRLQLNHIGTRLYVNDTGSSGAIHEIDAVTGSPTFGHILRTFNVGKTPSHPVLSPDDQYLYFGSPQAFNILDITSGMIVASIALPYGTVGPVLIAPDGSYALAPASNTPALRLIDLEMRVDRGEIALPDNQDHLAFSPDGRFLYLIMRLTQDLVVMDAATLQIVANLPADGSDITFIQSLVVSPDSQYVFAVAGGLSRQMLVYQPGDMDDITPPTVTSIAPGSASNVPVYAPISATFSEPLDRLTIHNGSIWLSANGAPQEGALHISLDNQTINLKPTLTLQSQTSYTLHLEHTLTDLAGNTLGLTQTATFTTAAALNPGPLNMMSATFSSNGSRGLAMSPDGSLLAVANRFQNSVSLLQPATMQPLLIAIPVSAGPRGLAFNSDGSRLYVVTNPGNTLVEIDVNTGQVVRTIANVLANEEIVISPDDSRAYTTGFNNALFQQIDLATAEITTPLGAVDKPGRPAYAPDGTLYLATHNILWRQNEDDSWTSIPTNTTYTLDVAFSADSRYAFMAQTWRDALLVVDLLQDAPLVEIPLDDEPRQMAQSADHRFLFVSNKTSATVQIVDTMALAVVQQVSLPGSQIFSVAWDDAGQRLFVADSINNLVRGFTLNYVAPPPTIRDDSSYEIQYNQWVGVADANALGGGYRATSTASHWVLYKSLTATEFALVTYMGPDQGKAYVRVDNVTISTLDLYAPTPQYQAVFTFTNLSDAPHNIMIMAAGEGNPDSAGTEVRIDGFIVNGQTIDDNAISLNYHGWSGFTAAWATNGATRLNSTAGNSATFTVNGDAFIWRTANCPICGQVEIQVDGNVWMMVDLYNPAWQMQYGKLIAGLGSGPHQITITILSAQNPASGGTLIMLDGYSYP